MPLYEYECTACHKHTEKIQKFSDAEITVCPHCGGKLERVLSAPAISFKGGGWYADGYGNAKPKSSGDSANSSSDSKSGTDSKPGDSKSENKSKSGGESKASGESKAGGDSSASTPAVSAPAPAAASASSSDKK
jgi:putative FmdB family regulatory protein